MPRFAVMTFMFIPWLRDGRISIEDMLSGFASAGVEGVEPFHRDFVEDPDLLKRYRRLVEDNGMKVAAVDVMCNLVYANEEQKRQDRDALRRGLDICKAVGTTIAHVAGHRLRDGVAPDDGRKMIAEGLMDVADTARDYGLTLAIEDFGVSPDLVCTAQDCIKIVELTGGLVKIVFDTGNFISVGERAEDNFDAMADRICHCHFKDFAGYDAADRRFHGTDLGAGVINNAEIARKLTSMGYGGWVALETISRDETDPVAAVRKELPLLKSWFSA